MAGRKLFLANMMVACMVLVLASRTLITTVAQDDPLTELGHGCSDKKYQNEIAFKDNLNASFRSLASNISSSNTSFFATNSSNKGNSNTDGVYALLLCRKYLTSQKCLQCFTEAENRLTQLCIDEGYIGGRIHLDGCLLRYENSSFFEEGTDTGQSTYCEAANDSKPQEFNETAEKLLSELTENAPSRDGYAIREASIASTTLYGVAQCVPTLSIAKCDDCLTVTQTSLVNNCLPKREGRGLQAGCFIRYAPYSFYGDSTSAPPDSPPPSNLKAWPIWLGSIGGAALLAILCSLFICRRFFQRRRYRYTKTEGDWAAAKTFEQVVFEYEALTDATRNFDRTNLLGKGGFGEVYKGILEDGRAIAVKKLSESRSSQAMEEFLTEVKLISSVRQRNLVRLLGCCVGGHERLLVYEFMSNNSLDKHLFGDTRTNLGWETRFNIIVGTARGLAYLHEDSNIRIVHRDIKAANILLDDKFHPKIADFGLAKFFPEGETHLCTRVGGTIGYMAPEYAVHGELSEKADVYSYGVLVLEIISGRKCINRTLSAPLQLLLEWAWRQYQSDQALEIVDMRIGESQYPREQVLRVINIALLCCQATPVERPTMSGVVSMLTTASEINVRPTQPAFTDAGVTTQRPPSSTSASTSGNDSAQSRGTISISLTPR